MIRKLFIPAICLSIAIPNTTDAATYRLVATTSSTPGSYCYEGANSPGDYIVGKCDCQNIGCGNTANFSACPTTTDAYNSNLGGDCLIGTDANGTKYFCYAGGESACSACGMTQSDPMYSKWSTYSGYVVSRQKASFSGSDSRNYYYCSQEKPATTEYGCAAGYYQSGGSGASTVCSRCPASGGTYGTNAIGTTDITTCCVPAGTSFSDTNGTGTFNKECCYTQ
ncbi:MAG: hypothetical protein K2I81_02875 [Alphaproteobacteria bacterium]|nr:hypothetical protein [Alphaproteobacteria bacterium]